MLGLAACGGGGGSSPPASSPPPQLVSISVTPAANSIIFGSNQQFTATGTYSDNSTQDITASVSWTSTGAVTEQINTTGLVTATTVGTTTITATSGTVSKSTSLTVTAAPQLISIAVTPTAVSISTGTTQQYSAVGTYADNSTHDISTSVTWTSTGAVTEPISSSGLATATTVGITTISAHSGNIVSNAATLTVTQASNQNIMTISVNGSLCSASTNYPNKPCVSVTVCTPDNSACHTVNDILLDTGSIGLRVFKSALGNLSLPQAPSGSGSLAECIQFADLSSIWGPVQRAGVTLGNEPVVQVPIQVIDRTFGTIPAGSVCQNADATPADAGYNGVLGVGVFNEDCGSGCAGIHSNNQQYFSCSGTTTCTGASVETPNQVLNPVAQLPTDNNGILITIPAVPPGGQVSVTGQLIMGIGTQANNTLSGVTKFSANSIGEFRTVFNSTTFTDSFLDTGSNATYFGDGTVTGLTVCGNWYCPPSTRTLSATTVGSTGSPSTTISFPIGNANNLFLSSSNVFRELGGPAAGTFDWGLPFYLGRPVFQGFEGKSSSLGSGMFWAY